MQPVAEGYTDQPGDQHAGGLDLVQQILVGQEYRKRVECTGFVGCKDTVENLVFD